MPMTPESVTKLFTRSDGAYVFARWGRPLAPVLFGVEDETISLFKGAFEAVGTLTHHPITDLDPELGSNVMLFFVRDWDELRHVPDLDRLIDGLFPLLDRLETAEANQYRIFRFDENGAIRAAFLFLRMDDHLGSVSADSLALAQAAQTFLLWSDTAFQDRGVLEVGEDGPVLRADIAGVLRAAYDPVLPASAADPAHALRLYARIGVLQ